MSTNNAHASQVYLLYALYPCDYWDISRHGGSKECECDEYLEGVFSTPEKARAYIPEALNEHHANLQWETEDRTSDYGYYDEYARTNRDKRIDGQELVYHIRRYEVDLT